MNLIPYVVFAFYDTLSYAYNANPYDPHQIWNYDEIGLQASRNVVISVLVTKGSKNMSYIFEESRMDHHSSLY